MFAAILTEMHYCWECCTEKINSCDMCSLRIRATRCETNAVRTSKTPLNVNGHLFNRGIAIATPTAATIVCCVTLDWTWQQSRCFFTTELHRSRIDAISMTRSASELHAAVQVNYSVLRPKSIIGQVSGLNKKIPDLSLASATVRLYTALVHHKMW